ncbi:MAG TPA: hypothetical protein VFZ00_21485 [Solirubrobacter sp.]|nr:hypothetical protein [Solirubrobacter sp.]
MKKLRFSGRAAIVCSLVLAIGIPSVAMGFGEGRNLLLGKRNPSSNPSLALNSETEIIANNATYGTRQSNKRDGDGGGAIYGCRSNLGNEPCVRANNLKGGHAFQFETTGREAGRIEVGNTAGAPFTTNATGVATGLNADKVDGKEAADFALAADVAASMLFAKVTDPGGDPTVTGRGATAVSQTDETYTVTFNRDVSACSYTATATGATAQPLAVAAGAANTQVNVTTNTDATTTEPDTSFQLQVIC